ncbi:MAG TPA: hypothetical protein VGT04_07065 [Acidobacteriaceae bacterium]|nr:hypothetical protein [Acidobacteriaceae bacterium]
MKSREIANTKKDATLPRTPVMIGGKSYDLCFDLGALSEAETELRRQGHDVNLLAALPTQNLANTRVIFAAAVRAFHPELGFEEAQKMLTIGDLYNVADAIFAAWSAAMPTPSEEKNGDPPQAAE